MSVVFPYTKDVDFLTLLVQAAPMAPAAGPLNGAHVHLFTNNFSPTNLSILADFTEAIFDGYAATTISAWDTPFTAPDLSAQVVGNTQSFLCSGNTTLQTVYGAYWTDSGGTVLLASERFAQAVPITGAGSGFVYVPTVNLANQ